MGFWGREREKGVFGGFRGALKLITRVSRFYISMGERFRSNCLVCLFYERINFEVPNYFNDDGRIFIWETLWSLTSF